MKKYLVILVILFAGSGAFGQQDILFTQYMYNKIALNPAYAGSQISSRRIFSAVSSGLVSMVLPGKYLSQHIHP